MTRIEKADLESKIEALTKDRDEWRTARREALEQIERLYVERDGLRRELCQLLSGYHGVGGRWINDVDIAKERSWDCFENCTQRRGEWLVNEGKA